MAMAFSFYHTSSEESNGPLSEIFLGCITHKYGQAVVFEFDLRFEPATFEFEDHKS